MTVRSFENADKHQQRVFQKTIDYSNETIKYRGRKESNWPSERKKSAVMTGDVYRVLI